MSEGEERSDSGKILDAAFENTIRKVRALERVVQASEYAHLAAKALTEAAEMAPELAGRISYQTEALQGHLAQLREMVGEVTFADWELP